MSNFLETIDEQQLSRHEADDYAFEQFKALLLKIPEDNKNKIAFIKEELDEGRYTIHSQTIAEKMLFNH